MLTLLCYTVHRRRITVRLRFVKVVLKVGWLSHFGGFEILAMLYAAHVIMWQLLQGHIDEHC